MHNNYTTWNRPGSRGFRGSSAMRDGGGGKAVKRGRGRRLNGGGAVERKGEVEGALGHGIEGKGLLGMVKECIYLM